MLDSLPSSVRTVCVNILKADPIERPKCHEVIHYAELKLAMCKYYNNLVTPSEREIVEDQLHDVIGKSE